MGGVEATRRGGLVGRDAQLATLTQAVTALAEGRGGSVLVEGPAGQGKTRLVRAVLDAHDGLTVLWCAAHPLDRDLAYAPLVTALANHLDARPPHRREGLLDGLDVLGDLLDGYGLHPPPAVDAAIDRTRRAEAIRRLVGRIAAEDATVLVVDDLHLADTDTLGVLQRVATDLHRPPLLVVATFRPDEADAARPLLDRLRRDPDARGVTVPPLDDTESRQLLDDLTGDAVPDVDAAQLLARAAGNPLYLESLAAAWRSTGVLPPDPPVEATTLLEARMTGAPASARTALAALAVAGAPTPWPHLATIADLPEDELEEALEELGLRGLLRVEPATGHLTLAHPLFVEAAHAIVPVPRRQRMHAAAATAGGGAALGIGRRARHVREAGPLVPPDEALDVLEQAGELAAARLSGREVVSHVEAAITVARDHAPRRLPHLLELLAIGYYAQDEFAAALAVADEAIALATGDEDERAIRSRCLQLQALIHWYGNRHDLAREAHRRAVAATRTGDDPTTRAAVLLREAHEAMTFGDVDAATTAAEAMTRLADLEGAPTPRRAALLASAWVGLLRGEMRAVLADTTACIDTPPADEPVTGPLLGSVEVRAVSTRALAAAALGRGDRVPADVDLTITMSRDRHRLSAWRAHLAALLFACEAGTPDELAAARDHLVADLDGATRAEAPTVVHAMTGWAALAEDDVAAANAALDRARAHLPPDLPDHAVRPVVTDLHLGILAHTGDQEIAPWASPRLPAWPGAPWGAEARLVLARRGVVDDTVADRARSTLGRMGEPGDLPDLVLRAVTAVSDGHGGAPRLEEVAVDAEARGLRRRAARTWALAAEAHREDSRCETAARRALALADELRMPLTADRARRALRRVGVRVGRASRTDGPLTPRQREIAALVAEGLSNAEVADRLFISVRTVTTHLDNAYTALGIRSRAQLAAWWAGEADT